MTHQRELGSQCLLTERLWKQPNASELIGKARLMMHHALKSKGVKFIIQHHPMYEPRHFDEYIGEMVGPYYHLAASGWVDEVD